MKMLHGLWIFFHIGIAISQFKKGRAGREDGKTKKIARVHQTGLSVKPTQQKEAAVATEDAVSKIKHHFPVQPSLKND